MKTLRLKASALAVASLVSFGAALPAQAQSSDGAGEQAKLEEIVVTARRRSESLQDVPIAVTAITGDQLSLRGAADISELTQSVPSLTV